MEWILMGMWNETLKTITRCVLLLSREEQKHLFRLTFFALLQR